MTGEDSVSKLKQIISDDNLELFEATFDDSYIHLFDRYIIDDFMFKFTALGWAVREGAEKIVNKLTSYSAIDLSKGAKMQTDSDSINLPSPRVLPATPLALAANRNDRTKIVKILHAAGATFSNAEDPDRSFPSELYKKYARICNIPIVIHHVRD